MLTVGGSHQPLLIAIEKVRPDFIVFVCSTDDHSGAKGSYMQIEGTGSCIKAHPADDKPGLPNVPIQAGYSTEQFRVHTVDADDIDNAYHTIKQTFTLLLAQYQHVACDYTGGTKSMSSALVLAAFEHPEVSVYVVTGLRRNLDKVEAGRSRARPARYLSAQFSQQLQTALSHWSAYSYASSASLLKQLQPAETNDHNNLDIALAVSRAFAAWDVFDHANAREELTFAAKYLGRRATQYFSVLQILTGDSVKKEPLQILDLWLNAKRCAARHRYDDATSRAYRMIEWCGQWLLRHFCDGLEANKIPQQRIPDDLKLAASNRYPGFFQASLTQVWRLYEHNCTDVCENFWANNAARLRNVLQSRNESVLAHGFRPVSNTDWAQMESFVEDALLPEMLRHFCRIKVTMPTQLPDRWIGQPVAAE